MEKSFNCFLTTVRLSPENEKVKEYYENFLDLIGEAILNILNQMTEITSNLNDDLVCLSNVSLTSVDEKIEERLTQLASNDLAQEHQEHQEIESPIRDDLDENYFSCFDGLISRVNSVQSSIKSKYDSFKSCRSNLSSVQKKLSPQQQIRTGTKRAHRLKDSHNYQTIND